jgi:uncharacterized protein YndB with AHSA1/START domain
MTEGITITRVFDAPREQVWKEWTEPERFADWYGGGEAEVPVSTVSMDVREGGRWRATPDRLVFTVSDQPGEDAWELVTVILTDLGDGRTEMHFEQRGQLPPEVYERAGQGWSTFFDRIAERLAAA